MKLILLLLTSLAGTRAFRESLLVGTSWRMKLNIGLEPGSWMPRAVDGWGSSGGRLLVDALVDFEGKSATEGEELVGPAGQTRVLRCRGGGSVVTERGEEDVHFSSGGWCVQRSFGSPSTSEGLLRFWLDCPTGCAKRDIVVPRNERIFFSTSVWDDAEGVRDLLAQKLSVQEELQALTDRQKEAAKQRSERPNGLGGMLQGALDFRRTVSETELRTSLSARSAFFDRYLPGLGQGAGENDALRAQIAPEGSLSLKRQRGTLFGPRTEYHILGTFRATLEEPS